MRRRRREGVEREDEEDYLHIRICFAFCTTMQVNISIFILHVL